MKKTVAILCCMAMLLTVLVGCSIGDQSTDTGESETKDIVNDTETDTEGKLIEYDDKGFVKDYIPEGLNFNKKKIKIVGWHGDNGEMDFDTDYTSDNGSAIPKATYERNNMVQERLNVILDIDYTLLGHNDARASYIANVETSMIDAKYDIIACYSQSAANFAVDGYTVDLMEYDHIFNFDMPWWSDSLTRDAMVNNKLYFASGPISTTNILQTMCMAVNMNMVDELGRDDPRDLVKDGEWTMEAFYNMCKESYKNTNQQNVNKDKLDTFGFVSGFEVFTDGFFASNGFHYYGVDDDGSLKVAEDFTSVKVETLITELRTAFNTNDYWNGGNNIDVFTAGRAMLYSTHFADIMKYRNEIEFDYGYVPFPSAEAGQPNYTTTGFPYTMWCMTNCPEGEDAEKVAYVMECLASESYRKIQPAVYDLIKYRNNDDPVNIDMFEIILENKIYDLGRLFINVGEWEDCAVGLFRSAVNKGVSGNGWIGTVDGKVSAINGSIETINKAFGY